MSDPERQEKVSKPHDHVFRLVMERPENALALLQGALPPAIFDALGSVELCTEPPNVIDAELAEDYRDLLFSCRLGGRPALLYWIVEHQRAVDPLMPYRIASYVTRLWAWWLRRNPTATRLPVVIPLVVHQGPGGWDGPRRLAELFDAPSELLPHVERLMPGLELALKELGTQAPRELAAHPGPPAVPVTLTVLRVVVDPACDLFEALEAVAGRLAELVREPGGARTLGAVLRYALMVRRGLDVRVLKEHVERVAGAEVGEVVMSTAQELIDQGVKQGRQEGQLEALRRVLLRQLRAKFSPLPVDAERRVVAASEVTLERWADAVLTATRIEEVWGGA